MPFTKMISSLFTLNEMTDACIATHDVHSYITTVDECRNGQKAF